MFLLPFGNPTVVSTEIFQSTTTAESLHGPCGLSCLALWSGGRKSTEWPDRSPVRYPEQRISGRRHSIIFIIVVVVEHLKLEIHNETTKNHQYYTTQSVY